MLAANQHPDHDTICAFRRRHLQGLWRLFVQVLAVCREAGLVKLGHVALDGTKVQANASKHKAMSYGRMKQEIARLEAEVEPVFGQIKEARGFRQFLLRGREALGAKWRLICLSQDLLKLHRHAAVGQALVHSGQAAGELSQPNLGFAPIADAACQSRPPKAGDDNRPVLTSIR